jgi:hypothetical protein
MQLRWIQLGLCIALLASGCELVADFDRAKIPGTNPDSGVTLPPVEDDDAGDKDKDASEADAN